MNLQSASLALTPEIWTNWSSGCSNAVKTVALESTSVYWIPFAQKLDAAGLEVVLVNARHIHHVPGGKTDCKDCQWLKRLHSYGLLSGSFPPGRRYLPIAHIDAQRDNLTKASGQQVQHMQKALPSSPLSLVNLSIKGLRSPHPKPKALPVHHSAPIAPQAGPENFQCRAIITNSIAFDGGLDMVSLRF